MNQIRKGVAVRIVKYAKGFIWRIDEREAIGNIKKQCPGLGMSLTPLSPVKTVS